MSFLGFKGGKGMVRRISYILFLTVLSFLLYACGPEISTTVQTQGPTVQEVLTYQGPKARIAVANFTCKAAKCSWEIGQGLSDMLATSLFRTGRFIVLERGEGLRAIKEEIDLGQSGYVQAGKAPQMGLLEGADILVMGAITAFEPEASGIGGGGLIVPLPGFGGVAVGKKDAYIAADIRLVDVRTGRVINATRVEGKASSWKVGVLAGGIVGTVGLGGALGTYKNTPMEKAIMVMLDNAIQAISQMVPQEYYRYGETGPVSTPLSSSPVVTQQPVAVSPSATYEPFVNPKVVELKGSKINVRTGPGKDYPLLTTVEGGLKAKAIGKQGEWYQLQLPDGRIGWVHKSLVIEK
jgi:curli biogenesis system outer membrane secretion channel CsgG